MKKICLVNQKGGVGKTTCCINLAEALKMDGKTVGLIDCDPQAHLTYGLGIEAHTLEYTLFDLIAPQNKVSLEKVAMDRGGLRLVPSSIKLSMAEMQPMGRSGDEYFLLKDALEGFEKRYSLDVVLIDCPPSLGILSLNALTYGTEVFIVSQPEFLALHGIKDLLQTIETVKKRLNKKIKISGVIINQFDGRKNLNREVVSSLSEKFPKQVFNVHIRENIALAESVSHGKTIFEYKPKSTGAEDFKNLAKEIQERWKI